MNAHQMIDMFRQVVDRGDGDNLVAIKDQASGRIFFPVGLTVEPIATDGDGHVVSLSGTTWIDVTEY